MRKYVRTIGIKSPISSKDVENILAQRNITAKLDHRRGDIARFHCEYSEEAVNILWDHGCVDIGTIGPNMFMINLNARFVY